MLGWGKSIFAHGMDVKFWGSEGGLWWVELIPPKDMYTQNLII